MKMHGEVQIYLHVFLTLAVDWGEWSAWKPQPFYPGERVLSTHCIGGWVGLRAALDMGIEPHSSSP